MNKYNYRLLFGYVIVYIFIQIPLLYKLNLNPDTIAFFYIGFLLFLPVGFRPAVKLLIGFFIGLLIDIFTNTPGLHAGISVFILFIRDQVINITLGDLDENPNLSIYTIGFKGIVLYLLPLVFLHIILLFSIEQGTVLSFFAVIKKSILSSLFTFVCIILLNSIVARRPSRI